MQAGAEAPLGQITREEWTVYMYLLTYATLIWWGRRSWILEELERQCRWKGREFGTYVPRSTLKYICWLVVEMTTVQCLRERASEWVSYLHVWNIFF